MCGKKHGFGQNLFILPNPFIEPFKSPPNKTYRVKCHPECEQVPLEMKSISDNFIHMTHYNI